MKAPIDLSRFKVVHGNKVYNAVSLLRVEFPEPEGHVGTTDKPMYIDILAIDEDGHLVVISGEAQKFQFVPR